METRHRKEKEILARSLVSSERGWTRSLRTATQERCAPPLVNLEPAQNSPDITLHAHAVVVIPFLQAQHYACLCFVIDQVDLVSQIQFS